MQHGISSAVHPLAYVLLPDMRLSEDFDNGDIQLNLVDSESEGEKDNSTWNWSDTETIPP